MNSLRAGKHLHTLYLSHFLSVKNQWTYTTRMAFLQGRELDHWSLGFLLSTNNQDSMLLMSSVDGYQPGGNEATQIFRAVHLQMLLTIQNPWLLYNIYGKPVARGRIEVFDPKVFPPQLVSFILGMDLAQHLWLLRGLHNHRKEKKRKKIRLNWLLFKDSYQELSFQGRPPPPCQIKWPFFVIP